MKIIDVAALHINPNRLGLQPPVKMVMICKKSVEYCRLASKGKLFARMQPKDLCCGFKFHTKFHVLGTYSIHGLIIPHMHTHTQIPSSPGVTSKTSLYIS